MEEILNYPEGGVSGSFETSIQRHIPEDCDLNNCLHLKSRKVGVL